MIFRTSFIRSDLKANFPGDDCGLYCEKMNLLVTIPITETTYVEVGDCDGSGDGETSMMARMGLDFVLPVIDVSIDEIEVKYTRKIRDLEKIIKLINSNDWLQYSNNNNWLMKIG